MRSENSRTLAAVALALSWSFASAFRSFGGDGEAKEEQWDGTLDIGTLRYGVSCRLLPSEGWPTGSQVSLSLQGQTVASALSGSVFMVPECDESASRALGGALSLFVCADMRLTEAEIRANGYTNVTGFGSSSNAWWESTNTVQLMDDLPVRVRLFYEACEGGLGRETYRASRITVYSLGEWNNRLNDNLVMRLEYQGGKRQCVSQSASRR